MRFWDLRKRGIAVSNSKNALPTSADNEKIRLSPVERVAAHEIAEKLNDALQSYRGMPNTEDTRVQIQSELNRALRRAFDELGSTLDVRLDVVSTRDDSLLLVPANPETRALLESLSEDSGKETRV